jgi:hypothetical protein
MAERAEPYKDYLGAASYRLLFGRPDAADARTSRGRSSGISIGMPSFSRVAAASGPTDMADVLVNNRAQPGLGQSEVSIASSGGTLVAAWNDAAGFYVPADGLSGWGVSTDRGQTWTDGGGFPRMATAGFIHGGDPALAVNNDKDFLFADLCFDGAISGICVTTGLADAVTVNWATPIYAASSTVDFLDKEFIDVDHTGTDVYVTYTRFVGFANSQIDVVASHDGGASFGAPVVAGPIIAGTVNQGSEPAVAPNGDVYVVWERGWLTSPTPDIVVATSTDGGASFGPPSLVSTISSIAFSPPSGYNRPTINDFPRIAVAQTGVHRGRVYVTYHDAVLGDADVFLSYSDDGGASWSTPVLVNDDGPGALQFWPMVHVEPGGNVDVMWYDRRLNAGTSITNTFMAQSTDGGVTFGPNVRVSDVGTDWAATATDIIPNFGDYNDISTSGNRTFAVWGDGRLGDPDVFFSEVRFQGKKK